jgi:translation machinery-associated protein 16
VDLTHPANVALFRQWDQTEAAYVQMLRFVRISSENPAVVIVSRPGKHVTLKEAKKTEEDKMDQDDVPELISAAGL